ncbi:MAG: dTDP-4-dehydrorhamnose 3,5-epimerase [Pseudomonadota bacterium]
MRFSPTEVTGCWLLDIEPHTDERGLFARTACEHEFSDCRLNGHFVQSSISVNVRRGTLRGLHLQLPPSAEAKLVRCTRGRIFDVVLDLRTGSSSQHRWQGFELSSHNHRALYIPPGCAHGFQTLEDDCDIFYQMTDFYAPDLGFGVRWNDPLFDIKWPLSAPTLLERDANYPDFNPQAFEAYAW